MRPLILLLTSPLTTVVFCFAIDDYLHNIRFALEGAQKMIKHKAEFAAYPHLWVFPGPPQLNPHFVHLYTNLDLSERRQ